MSSKIVGILDCDFVEANDKNGDLDGVMTAEMIEDSGLRAKFWGVMKML